METPLVKHTSYNRDLLDTLIARDDAQLLGEYDSLHVYSIIKFTCKCGTEGSKNFRCLNSKGGAYCRECAKRNGRIKAEEKNIERFGVKNPFSSPEVKKAINDKYKEKSTEEKNKIIEKRLNTVNSKSQEEKRKTIQKRITTYSMKPEEEKHEIKEKRKKTNSSKTEEEKQVRLDKIKETCLVKYGVDNPFKSKEVSEKIKNTNLERYGVENVFSSSDVKEKIKSTNIEKYGTEYATQSLTKEEWDRRMEKRKQTNIERFGYENPAQHPETFEKIQESAKRFKYYTMPSGEVRKIQGYEAFALDELVQIYSEEQIKTNRKDVGRIKYTMNGVEKYYNPDIGIPHENKLIEVKSKFTYTIEQEKIKCKGDTCKALGYSYEIWIYDVRGKKLRGKEVVVF